jgi:uncharacterized transporter YbjL
MGSAASAGPPEPDAGENDKLSRPAQAGPQPQDVYATVRAEYSAASALGVVAIFLVWTLKKKKKMQRKKKKKNAKKKKKKKKKKVRPAERARVTHPLADPG